MKMHRQTLNERSVPGRSGIDLPPADVPHTELPDALLRNDNELPELSQLDVMRHYLALSHSNFGVDTGFYPLGSCTMKYNPRICEDMARLPGFVDCHPFQPSDDVQGNLALIFDLQKWLCEIGGFAAVSVQPAAGAHGELTALLMMRAYHADRDETNRTQILIPDSAHGTNPASTAMAGFDVLEVPTDGNGNVDLAALEVACDETVAGLMLTNPNTLGLFEQHVEKIVRLVHGCGGLVYGDGANMNALTGIARPGDMGIDLMHYNLHKTFATPHGGGGPGSGPVGASDALSDYLPGPMVDTCVNQPDGETKYVTTTPEKSIGRMCTFFGNFGMFVRAYAYLRMHGAEGLRDNAIHAVLNANYLRVRLRDTYPVPFDRLNMHEFVCRGQPKDSAVRAFDVSKRLLDYGFHPPTNYFPLIVPEALMIEPTETESRQTLDAFVDAMLEIAAEAIDDPERLRTAPHTTAVGRLDETRAARDLVVTDRAGPQAS